MSTKSKIKVHVKKPSSPVIIPPKKKNTSGVGGMVADYDVRITIYNVTRRNARNAVVVFKDSMEELLIDKETDRIELMKEGNRLYFKKNTYGKRGDGTACVSHSKLQYSRQQEVDILKQFIGEYSLDFDAEKNTYYVDLDKRRDLTNTLSGNHNVPHNYGPKAKGQNFKGIEENPAVDVDLKILDVQAPDAATKLDKPVEATPVVASDLSKEKADIIQLLGILDNDKTDVYARQIVQLIKDKVTAL